MKIYGNSELTRIRVEINKQLDMFTDEVQTVNNQYTPVLTKIKRRRSNIIYYIVMTLFLLIFVSMAIFLGVVEAFYLALILFGINFVLIGVGVFFFRSVNKDYLEVKKMWDTDYKNTLKIKDKISELYESAESEVYKVIVLTTYNEDLEKAKTDKDRYRSLMEDKILEIKEKVKKELKEDFNSENVVGYYNEWADRIINQGVPSYDYLEARRRKAEIKSKKIDIDKGGED